METMYFPLAATEQPPLQKDDQLVETPTRIIPMSVHPAASKDDDHIDNNIIDLDQGSDQIATDITSAEQLHVSTHPGLVLQNDISAHVHIAPIPTSFSLEVALESSYVFDIIGAKVAQSSIAYLPVSSVLRLEGEVNPELQHPRQTAPPPAIFQTQVPSSTKKSAPFNPDANHNNSSISMLVKTETVIVVGSQIFEGGDIKQPVASLTQPSLSLPPSIQQQIVSQDLQPSVQQRIQSMKNPAITPPSSYVNKETPKPTLSRHDDTMDIGIPDIKNADTGLASQESSESFTIYSTNPSEKRITNGNGSNYQKNRPFKLADGFICLIIIGLLFILATSFYFYMRRRRKNRSVASQGTRESGSGPDLIRNVVASSGPSSRPSTLSKEPSYHVRGARYGEKHRQYVPDSGTDISNRYNKMDNTNNDNAILFRNSNAATINMYPLQSPANDIVPHDDQFEHWRAIDINDQSSYAAGKADQEYTDHCIRTAAAGPATRNVYGASSSIECVESTNGDEGRPSDKRNYAPREPAKAQPPPSDPYQYNPVGPENNKMTIRLHMPGNNKTGNEYKRNRGTTPNESKSAASNQAEKQNMLLDTSSVNPGMSEPTKNNFQKQQQKPRKLIRDSTKRNKAHSPAKEVKVPDEKTEKTYEHKGNTSLRTMFRNQPPEQKYSHKGKSARKVEHPVNNNSLSNPDISRQEIQNKLESEHLLTDSIESLSDSYQLAVRHKPPLGPLRAVEPHTPSLNDELTVERGDRMYVFGEFADGWVLSINVTRGKDMGMVPRRCIFFPTAPFMTEEAIAATCASPTPDMSHPHATQS